MLAIRVLLQLPPIDFLYYVVKHNFLYPFNFTFEEAQIYLHIYMFPSYFFLVTFNIIARRFG